MRHSPGWPWISYIVEGNLELLVLPSLPANSGNTGGHHGAQLCGTVKGTQCKASTALAASPVCRVSLASSQFWVTIRDSLPTNRSGNRSLQGQVITEVGPGAGETLRCLPGLMASFPATVTKDSDRSNFGENGFARARNVRCSPRLWGAKAAGVWSSWSQPSHRQEGGKNTVLGPLSLTHTLFNHIFVYLFFLV